MLLLIPTALALVAGDAAPCYAAWIEFIVPANGAEDVSPDTVPALGVDATCGGGVYSITLTPNVGEVQSTTATIEESGWFWLDELELAPGTAYVLSISSDETGTSTSQFTTGDAAIDDVTGTPTLTILSAELAEEATNAAVSMDITLVASADPSPWEVTRVGEGVAGMGVDDGELVDFPVAGPGDELCYTVTQYRADGVDVGTSEPACVTIQAATSDCGCSTGSGAPVGLGLLLALLVRRR